MKRLEVSELIETLGFPYLRELASFGALSDDAIETLLRSGTVDCFHAGERLERFDKTAKEFNIVLRGKFAFYKRGELGQDVLTRHFLAGDQMGFDLMIGLITHNGTDVAIEDSMLLELSSAAFFDFHRKHPEEFGLLMINLSRELSREIALLEDVIVNSVQGTAAG